MRHAIVAALLLGSIATQPVHAATSSDGQRLLAPDGTPMFITGMNYEGPADRAWQMWQDDKFDSNLIEADFKRASQQAGLNVLRLFVQAPLLADINAGKFDKLDAVVALAEKYHLQLDISLHDYGERDISKVSAVAAKLAQRYHDRPGVLAFDLKNEPRFGDLAVSIYKDPVPLQQHGLIDTYGERLPRDQVADYRASDEGKKDIPAYLSDDQAYIYDNNLRLYRELLADAAAWAKTHGGDTLDYLDAPEGQQWAPFTNALNATLQAWIQPQLDAIKGADAGRSVTVDHVDLVLARLPANDLLDFESLHRYPSATGASIAANLSLLRKVESTHAGKPFVLTEFGYATDSLDPTRSELDETAIELGLLSMHAAGGVKWMLNDMPPGFNQRERTLGAFQLDGSPKPVVGALSALRTYLNGTSSGPGTFRADNDADTGVRYVYRGDDALMVGGMHVDAGAVSFDAGGPAQLFLTWSSPGAVQVWASTPLTVSVDLNQLLGKSGNDVHKLNVPAGASTIPIPGSAATTPTPSSAAPTPTPGSAATTPAPGSAAGQADYDIPNGHFFTQTNGQAKGSSSGFAVTDADGVPLWSGFNALGGVDVLGYPVTRRFEMDGFVVQAFQKSVLQWRPDQKAFNFLNTFDVLHDRGFDKWLSAYRQTPPPQDNSADAGLPWDRVVARHLTLLDKVPQPLKDAFLADPDWIDHYGLPVATQETQNSVVVRAQRAALQYWKEAVPWAAQGTVSVANGGDLAKEVGVFPSQAVIPENAPH